MEDVKLKLSILLIARMLTGLQGDVIRYMQPGMLEDIIGGSLDIPITEEILMMMAVMIDDSYLHGIPVCGIALQNKPLGKHCSSHILYPS